MKSTDSFEQIYKEYFLRVYKYMRGLTADENLAEEITEETFFKALKTDSHWRQECDIFVWLCQIAKNTYFSHLKKQKRQVSDDELNILPDEESIEKIIADKDLAIDIHRIIHNMKEPYKEVFSLRVFGELQFRDIGLIFGKSEHWACVTYHRAKEKIQSELRRDSNGN